MPVGFEEAVRHTTEALKQVTEAFQKKLGIDFRNYRIPGACNPTLAHEELILEDKVGTKFPCNVSDISLAADPAIQRGRQGQGGITARDSDNAVFERTFDLEQRGS